MYPNCWKTVFVLPLPKLNNPTEYIDVRPICMLPTLSKVHERILYDQMWMHSNDILPNNQSGFRANHSCATSLLSVTDDILSATDNGLLTTLALLDYPKAIDIIHQFLLATLHNIGFDNSAVNLMKSYITERT